VVDTGTEEVIVTSVSCTTPPRVTVLFTTTKVGVLLIIVVSTSPLSFVCDVSRDVGGGVVVGFVVSVLLVSESVGLVVVGDDVLGIEVLVGVVEDDEEVVGGSVVVVDGGLLVVLDFSVVVSALPELPPVSSPSTTSCLRASPFSPRSGLNKLACVMVNRIANTASNRKLSRENMTIEDA